jgi:hypothetical protein
MAQHFTHERLKREEQVAPGSERSFAIVMVLALTVIGGINFWHSGRIWPWLGVIIVLLVIAACFAPTLLRPLNRLWFQFGLLLHAVINPLVMGLVFFGAVLPTGLVMRALGKDPLHLKIEGNSESYWVKRRPPGPAPETMKDQF